MKAITLSILAAGLVLSTSGRADTASPSFVAHEWGTFTSVQGSDGEPILWNPFVKNDLPDFVYDRRKPSRRPVPSLALMITKNEQRWLQRMETPVIYFHATNTFSVDVKVNLPDGLITEWYPAATSFGPTFKVHGLIEANKESHLHWRDLLVHGLPGMMPAALPTSLMPNHYFAAREASSSVVQTRRGIAPEDAGEVERYLFYRGVGNFAAPLRAGFNEHGALELRNTGDAGIPDLFVFRRRGDRAELHHLAGLNPRERREIRLDQTSGLRDRESATARLAASLRKSLETAGLYSDEAEAMINTWKNDWFGEQGLRVLYLLPSSWTDQTLPLQISPRPTELVRVMVGRAEILEPDIERKMELLLTDARQTGGEDEIPAMVSLIEKRFLDPALTRAMQMQLAREKEQLAARWQEPALAEKFKEARRELLKFVGKLRSRMASEIDGLEALAAVDPFWVQ